MPSPDWSILHGDVAAVLATLPYHAFDALIADPPSGRSFLGIGWDANRGGRSQWIAWVTEWMAAARRVVKPGGWAFVWTLPRTTHWTRMGIEDAGWEVRGELAHIQAQGKPSSDAMLGPAREDWVLCRAPDVLLPLQIAASLVNGRYPKNVAFGHAEECGAACVEGCPVRTLDRQGGIRKSSGRRAGVRKGMGYRGGKGDGGPAVEASSGYASRFFFCSKLKGKGRAEADHACAKPLPLMDHMVRLITPPGGALLELFSGSGQGGIAAMKSGLVGRYVGIDNDTREVAKATRRIAAAEEAR